MFRTSQAKLVNFLVHRGSFGCKTNSLQQSFAQLNIKVLLASLSWCVMFISVVLLCVKKKNNRKQPPNNRHFHCIIFIVSWVPPAHLGPTNVADLDAILTQTFWHRLPIGIHDLHLFIEPCVSCHSCRQNNSFSKVPAARGGSTKHKVPESDDTCFEFGARAEALVAATVYAWTWPFHVISAGRLYVWGDSQTVQKVV